MPNQNKSWQKRKKWCATLFSELICQHVIFSDGWIPFNLKFQWSPSGVVINNVTTKCLFYKQGRFKLGPWEQSCWQEGMWRNWVRMSESFSHPNRLFLWRALKNKSLINCSTIEGLQRKSLLNHELHPSDCSPIPIELPRTVLSVSSDEVSGNTNSLKHLCTEQQKSSDKLGKEKA